MYVYIYIYVYIFVYIYIYIYIYKLKENISSELYYTEVLNECKFQHKSYAEKVKKK